MGVWGESRFKYGRRAARLSALFTTSVRGHFGGSATTRPCSWCVLASAGRQRRRATRAPVPSPSVLWEELKNRVSARCGWPIDLHQPIAPNLQLSRPGMASGVQQPPPPRSVWGEFLSRGMRGLRFGHPRAASCGLWSKITTCCFDSAAKTWPPFKQSLTITWDFCLVDCVAPG